jgi:hypothetical protein
MHPATRSAAESDPPAPDHLLEIGFAFRKSKALLSAVELGVFNALADGPRDCDSLVEQLALHGRGARDFFDALVALDLLERDAGGRYANTPECAHYLDPLKPTYIGGLFDYLNDRMYQYWGLLTPALRTGQPQTGPSPAGGFSQFYADEGTAKLFLNGMAGGSIPVGQALAEHFPWRDYGSFIDVGTALGAVPVEIARAHTHLRGGGFDLPTLADAFATYVHDHGLGHCLTFHAGDFFVDPLPQADVLIMGRILHDWDIPNRMLLLRKAYEALPSGGALIVFDTLIDRERRHQPHSLLASLNMLIQTAGGSEYSAEECMIWMQEAGFARMQVLPLTRVQTAVLGFKQGE